MRNNKKNPLISIIVLNYNGCGILEPCLRSIFNSDYPDFEIILVDNASTDDSLERAKQQFGRDSRFKVIQNSENLFFAEGNNIGIRRAQGEYIFLLSNDVEIEPKCLSEIATAFKGSQIGAAQPKVFLFNSSKFDNTGGLLDRYGYSQGRGRSEMDLGQYDKLLDIFYAGGAAMILSKRALDEVGLFDSKFYVYCEDVDLSWRIRLKGYKIVLLPKAKVYHRVSAVTSKNIDKFNLELKWHIRKNRIATLIKNYSPGNLLRYLPIILSFYFLIWLKELIINRKPKLSITSVRAIFWNIKELFYLVEERKRVQSQIRQITDEEILKFMQRGSILWQNYLFPIIKKSIQECGK